MKNDELASELRKIRGTFYRTDYQPEMRLNMNQDDEEYCITKRRRQSICEKFFIDWFTQNIPKLAREFNVSEDRILKDLMSHEFMMFFREKVEIPSHGTDFRSGSDSTRERYRSAIHLASLSSDDPLIALQNTLTAIRNYIEKIKRNVMIANRIQIEAMLVSKAGAETGENCDKCGAPMRLVNVYGGDSYFAGCSNYPECYNQKQISVEMLEKIPRVIDRWNKGTMDEAISKLMPSEIHWHPSSYDEAATRRVFIDPILKSLGWDTYTDSNVGKEIKTSEGKADYLLYNAEGKVFAVVEAKKLFEDIGKHRFQLIGYMAAIPVNMGILTNGFDWDIFRMIEKDAFDKVFSITNIISETDEEVLKRLIELIRKR